MFENGQRRGTAATGLLPLLFLLFAGCVSSRQDPAQPTEPTPHVTTAGGSVTITRDQRYLFADEPIPDGYPNSWTVLTNIAYLSAYDETFKNPAWVAYRLHSGASFTPGPRPSGYFTDARTTSKIRAGDYPSGYDKGHLAPNNAIAIVYGTEAQRETFLMTNMLPQRHGLNAGPWKTVETAEYARWLPKRGSVWIICGPVYTAAAGHPIVPALRFGDKQVCIPVGCFKVVMAKDEAGQLATLAFIMPQENAAGRKPETFLTSIREIERRTGLNFFSSLPQEEQDRIENAVAAQLWPNG